jgi:secreted trypsin-like serine protease
LKRFLAVFAVLAAFAPATANAIVGGSEVSSITKFPFQVELWNDFGQNLGPVDGFFCGGVILDATHIATAAHCVFDDTTGQPTPPSRLHVLAGTRDLAAPGTAQAAIAASFDPRYNPNTNDYDMGVITLGTPLWPSGDRLPDGTNTIARVPLIAQDDTLLTAAGKSVTASGWGYDLQLLEGDAPDPNHDYPTKLRSVALKVTDPGVCAGQYTGFVNITARMLCAADNGKDSCFGDSGGPLVAASGPSTPASYQLAGLVESGVGCGDPNFSGIYDRVSNIDVRTFLTSSPPTAPQQQAPTSISESGKTFICAPGQWSNATTFEYEFLRDSTGEGAFVVSGPSAQNSYTVQSADVGAQLLCIVKASGAGGYGFGVSPVITGAAPAITTPPPTVADSSLPTLGIARKSCSTRGRCVVNMLVADAAPSSGIAKVEATLRWRAVVACKSAKKRCTRMKTKALKAQSIGANHFLVVVSRLKPGNYTLILTAVDKAGNKQRKPTHTTLTVKKRRR